MIVDTSGLLCRLIRTLAIVPFSALEVELVNLSPSRFSR
jgi:hypothetical protein